MHTRTLFSLLLVVVTGLVGIKGTSHSQSTQPAKEPIPTVAFCDLVTRPESYLGKVVRLRAIYFANFESAFLYDVNCRNSKDYVELICGAESCKAMQEKIDKTSHGDPFGGVQSALTLVGQLKYPETRYAEIDGKRVVEIKKYRLDFVIKQIEQAEPVPPDTPMPGSDEPATKKRKN